MMEAEVLGREWTAPHPMPGDDLLSLTNAAVSALSKETSMNPSGVKNPPVYVQSHVVLSPKSAPRRFESSPVMHSPLHPQRSKSVEGYHDESVLSRRSMASDMSTSIEHSTFLHGNAQKVKVSAKKLREIKSPFDAHVQSSYDSMLRESNDAKSSRESGTKESPERKTSVEEIELSSTLGDTGDPISKRIAVEKHIVPTQLKSYTQQSALDFRDATDRGTKNIDTLTTTVSDSGFVSHNIQVIRDVRGEPTSENSSIGDVASFTEEYGVARVVTAHHHEGDSQNSSCTQPEIVTVENTLNGEASQRDTSLHSDNSAHTRQSQQSGQSSLQDRFSRFQPALLKQGSLRGSSLETSMYSLSSKEDVQIAQYSLNDKHKLLKNRFITRNNGGPVKKHVQPKLVQPAVSSVKQHFSGPAPAVNNPDAISTAAVAAASAVAATQPFLKMQLDLEYRMAQVLDKLASSEKDKQIAPAMDDGTKRKLEELEHNLQDITQRRLDFLEEAQKQQIGFQAQLISMSRVPPAQITSTNQPVEATLREKDLHLEPRAKHLRSRSPTSPHRSLSEGAMNREVSVLSTPAPRHKPPRPLTNQARISPPRTAPGGFLAQILAETESPKHSPHRTAPVPLAVRHATSPTVKRAQHLLHELTGLRDQTENALQSNLYDRSAKLVEPAPLDTYLAKTEQIPPSSPYPVRIKISGDAPVLVNNYMDARETLKELQEKRSYLEANLDAILRARQESEVYAAIDTLTQGSMAERLRIRKLVDQHITTMSSQMESEVMHELLRMEEKSKLSFLIPERDTSKVKAKIIDQFGYKSKMKAQSRVDSGLHRAKQLAEMKLAALGKENIPKPLPKTTKSGATLLDDSRYVERVYGKTAQRGSRTTLKHQPYPHFQTGKAKTKPLIKPTETIKGVSMSTAKTQTKPDVADARQLGVSPMHVAVPLGLPRRVGSIAVQSPPAPPPTAVPSPIGQLYPQTASTPLGYVPRSTDNVGMVTIKDPDLQREERRKQGQQLSSKAITAVDIDTDSSIEEFHKQRRQSRPHSASPGTEARSARGAEAAKSTSTPRVADVPARSNLISPVLQKFVKDAQDELNEAIERSLLKDSFEESVDESVSNEIEGSPIALPGHTRPPAQPYHGPQFPPEAPPMREQKRQPIAEEELIFAQRQRDMLVHKANNWVEQELLAQVINEVYSAKNAPQPRRETVPHSVPLPKRSTTRGYVQVSQDYSEEEASGHDSLIAEALGQEGMQIFVDAGREVDESLVNALIKEVLQERITNMAGQRTSRDDEGIPHTVRTTKSKTKPTEGEPIRHDIVDKVVPASVRKARAPSPPVQMPDTPVPTPEPTPTGSPRASPPPHRIATPPETPDWTPEPSSAEDLKPPVLRERRDSYESDTEVEVVQEHDVKHKRDRRPPNREMYDVATPEHTPPASPVDVKARTPSPSIKEDDYTPIPSDDEARANEPTPAPTREPSPDVSVQEPAVLERSPPPQLVSHAIQTTPPPVEATKETSTSETETEEDETETSSWATQTETGNEQISEGQWLVSTKSEGEVAGAHIDAAWRERLREKVAPILTARSNDDTLHEAADIDRDQDLPTHRSHSEGEFIAPTGLNDDPYVAMMAQMRPQYGMPVHMGARRDKSLGEITVTGQADDTHKYVYGLSVPKRKGKKGKKSDYSYESPGELLDPAFPIGQHDRTHQEQIPQYDQFQYKPTPSARRGTPSPPPVAIRTISVQPSPTISDDDIDGKSPEAPVKTDDFANGKSSLKTNGAVNGNQQRISTDENRTTAPSQSGETGRHPSAGPIQSKSPMKSQVKRYRPGSGAVGGISAGGRVGAISPGGRSRTSDKRTYRSTELRRSQEDGLLGTRRSFEEGSFRSMTPDQMNVDALLESQDYLQSMQTDLSSTADLRLFRSTDFSRKSATFGEVSGEFGRGSTEFHGEADFEEANGTRGFMLNTMGSTSDMSLQEGLTKTLEREESEKLLSYTVDSESDMKQSVKYPDSLEGTGPAGTRDSQDLQQYGSRQFVSVTMPSVADEEYYDDQDASTLSNV